MRASSPRCRTALSTAAIAALLSAGCASTKVDVRKLQAVERAAVVAYECTLDPLTEVQTLDTLFVDLRGPVALTSQVLDQAEKNRAINEDLYGRLGACLAAELKWQVLTIDEVRKAPAYAQRDRELSQAVPGFITQLSAIPGILWTRQINQLGRDELRTMATELGVDALVVAIVEADTDFSGIRGTSSGIGSHRPYFRLRLEVFDARGETLWLERGAKGDPTRQSYAEILGKFEAQDRVPLLIEAFNNSCAVLVKQLRSAQQHSTPSAEEP